MISWLIFRMIEAHDKEQSVWRVHNVFDGFVVEDMNRDIDGPPNNQMARSTFQQHRFATTSSAASFLRFMAFRAALMAILQPWKPL